MLTTLSVPTHQRTDFVDITEQVQKEIEKSGVQEGIVSLYIPHTTCGITINESDDPMVAEDIKAQLEKIAPRDAGYKHTEGNADSHVKTSLMGTSETVIIEKGKILLGRWQGIFLCEFDGPRTRKVHLKIIKIE